MEIFRKYCIGDGAVSIQMLSDPAKTLVTTDKYDVWEFCRRRRGLAVVAWLGESSWACVRVLEGRVQISVCVRPWGWASPLLLRAQFPDVQLRGPELQH